MAPEKNEMKLSREREKRYPSSRSLPLTSPIHRQMKPRLLTWKNFSFTPLKRFHKFLDKVFRALGYQVALFPSYFILFPVFLTVLALTGFQQIFHEDNPEMLFYPATGPAPKERDVIETHFPINFSSNFLPHHMTRASGFARILLTTKDNGNIFRERAWYDLKEMDFFVRNINITQKGHTLFYKDICAKWNDNCHENRVLNLEPLIPEIEKGTFYVNYPIMLFPLILPIDFGGMVVDDEQGIIKSALSVSLSYFLRQNTDEEKEQALLWEQAFLDQVKDFHLRTVNISYFASRSRKDEMLKNTDAIKPFSAVAGLLMLAFSVGSVFTADWVRGKMVLGMMGVVSAGMATGTAFGALMYLGVPFISINKIIPFLMIGIGIDDMFVVLSSWRRTRIQDPVSKRLSETYSDAGISITITSLTNMLSFSVGITTPILGVQIFCIYTTLSVLLTYLWHLTFFGGCLALAGFLEKNQRHSLICIKVKAKSEAESEESTCYSVWCSGGVSEKDPWNERDNRPHVIMVAFGDYFSKFLNIPTVKVMVLCLFLLYLGGAIYGCTTLQEGLDRKHVVQYSSYANDYYDVEKMQFRKFPYPIQIVLTGNITYSDYDTKRKLLQLHDDFEKLPFTAESIFTQSWIRGWYRFVDSTPSIRRNITGEESFIHHLRSKYLKGSSNPMALDVKFSEDFSRIVASRITIHTYEITDTQAEIAMVKAYRHMAHSSPFDVAIYNPNFILFDQYTMVQPITVQAVSIAVVTMVAISSIFIPNPWCSLLVGTAIVSIETGVVGYMALWGVNLDQISMINLIMCIGFSVDFSAHISYAYLTAKVETSEGRLRECLYSLGLPILQGGLSTIVCIATFVLAPSYVYVTFFKIVFLVVFFATVHGLLLIPVLLSMFATESSNRSSLANAAIKIPRVKLTTRESAIDIESGDKSKCKKGPTLTRLQSLQDSGARPDPEGCSNRSFGKENEKTDTQDR